MRCPAPITVVKTIPYGYRKSTTEEYRFEPDPETAPIIKKIYALFLEGNGARPIVRILNDEGVPSPGKLRYLRGQTKRQCYSDCIWTQQCIKQILMNPTYMGDLVFGRMPTALYLGKPDYHYEPDESKWRILPDMHEALVSRGDFYKVREILDEGRRVNEEKLAAGKAYRDSHPQLFKRGIVRCGNCGSNLGYARKQKINDGRYGCRNKQYGRCDAPVTIGEKKLAEVVWNATAPVVRKIFDLALEGKKSNEIAVFLNDCKIETPSAYFMRMNPGSRKFRGASSEACWTPLNVRDILKRREYTGVMIMNNRSGRGWTIRGQSGSMNPNGRSFRTAMKR